MTPDVSFAECAYECWQITSAVTTNGGKNIDECLIVTYYTHVKTANDSRCYLFSDACSKTGLTEITSAAQAQVIYGAYKTVSDVCLDWPADWKDVYGDGCEEYRAHGICPVIIGGGGGYNGSASVDMKLFKLLPLTLTHSLFANSDWIVWSNE